MEATNLELVEKNRKLFILIVYISLVFIGGFIFPISIANLFPLVILMVTLISYFFVSFIFAGLYKNRPFLVLGSTFILTLIGLIGRVILEWDEFSLITNLNALNVGIHLSFTPLILTLFYLVIQKFLNKKANSTT